MLSRRHRFSSPLKASLLGLLLAAAMPSVSSAQAEAPKKELSDKVSEALAGIKTQTDAKNFDAALQTIGGLLTPAAPESYDRALLLQIKAQILLQKEQYAAAIVPLEECVKISDRNHYFDERATQDLVYYLAQLYYQEATSTKDTAKQKEYFVSASNYISRWLKNTKKANPDAQLFAASILYNQAQLNPEKVDMDLIAKAQAEVQKGLLMSPKPKDTFYVLLLATYQQQNKVAESAEVLELLVKLFPNNKNYWAQLAASYLNLQQDVRTILTIERAQKNGIMNTPKDNFNLVGMYFNIQQFDYAINLLEKGLRDGSIDSEKRNWELLAASYQQLRKEQKAIETLAEASKKYPDDGAIDQSISQIYYSMDKLEDAYGAMKRAVSKKVDKPGAAYTSLAYFCYELKKFDEAKVAIDKALESADVKKDDATRLKKAITDSINEREAYLNSKK